MGVSNSQREGVLPPPNVRYRQTRNTILITPRKGVGGRLRASLDNVLLASTKSICKSCNSGFGARGLKGSSKQPEGEKILAYFFKVKI